MSLVLMVTGTRCDRPDTRDVVCAARLRVNTATGDDSEESVFVFADVSPTRVRSRCRVDVDRRRRRRRRRATRRRFGRSVGRSVDSVGRAETRRARVTS